MYARVIRSESRLIVVGKVIFIEELIDTVKGQFFKDFRTYGLEIHKHAGRWLSTIFLEFFCLVELYYLFPFIWKKSLLKAIFIYN